MKLYQAGYYRLGGRGSGSGWNIVAPSRGMSEVAKAGFKGIAARLADLRQAAQMPAKAMGIFRHDRFVYLIHVNYAASGEDSRGVAYIHGYCFNLTEYHELSVHPEMLFGILPDQFDLEYPSGLSAYPVRESLEYRNMNERRLLDQYHISREQYKKLILGAICALEGYSSPMCVKYSGLQEQDTQIYRDVMYLIMKGMPYHLRQKLLSFSWQGMQTALYFSDTVQGENYADLDTGTVQCDESRLAGYHFTRLYNMDIFYTSRDTREQIFQNIAQFIDEAYADPFKDAGCALIEAGFQKKIKKNDGGIEPDTAVDLLQDFFKYELLYGRETAEYLALLLDALNQGGILVSDQKLTADIEAAYERCADELLLDPMAMFYARTILGQKKDKGFAALLELQKNHADNLYPYVCRHLEYLNSDFFADYFWNQFLPLELTSLKKAERFWKKNGESFSAKEQRLFQKLLRDLAEREMKAADSFEELCITAQVIDRIRQNAAQNSTDTDRRNAAQNSTDTGRRNAAQNDTSRIRQSGTGRVWQSAGQSGTGRVWQSAAQSGTGRIRQNETQDDGYIQLWDDTCFLLWDKFDMEWFETDSAESYQQYQVQKIARGYGQKSCPNAKKVSQMLSVLEEARGCRDVHRLWELLYDSRSEEDKKYKRKIQRGIREDFFAKYVSNARDMDIENLDCTLLLFYDMEKKQFDLVKWVDQWAKLTDMKLFGECLTEYGESSELLAEEAHKKSVLVYLEEAFRKNKKQTAYSKLAEDQKKALQILYHSLSGKSDSGNVPQQLVYSIHREVLGLFALLSLAVCGISLQRYGSGDIFIMMFFAVFLAVGLVLSAAVTAVTGGAVRSRAAVMGLGSAPAKCLYVCIPPAFAVAAVYVYQMDGFTRKAVCLMVFLALAAAMIVVCGVTAAKETS